jgi:hypothetical protein
MKNEGTFLLHEATFVLVKSTMKCVLCGFSMFSTLSKEREKAGGRSKRPEISFAGGHMEKTIFHIKTNFIPSQRKIRQSIKVSFLWVFGYKEKRKENAGES